MPLLERRQLLMGMLHNGESLIPDERKHDKKRETEGSREDGTLGNSCWGHGRQHDASKQHNPGCHLLRNSEVCAEDTKTAPRSGGGHAAAVLRGGCGVSRGVLRGVGRRHAWAQRRGGGFRDAGVHPRI